jgi:hypothetical protein
MGRLFALGGESAGASSEAAAELALGSRCGPLPAQLQRSDIETVLLLPPLYAKTRTFAKTGSGQVYLLR